MGDLDAALFQIHGRRAERRVVKRNVHLADKSTMQQGRECAGIDHESRGRAVHGAIDVKIVALAQEQRYFLQPAILDSWRAALRSEERRVGKECRCRWSR